ncbi:hypothetical protein K5D56_25470 [Pseudomonas cichorii]|nr:hypothetical protein [Pseudomonas cichorii]MBX8556999.1 hypothetical protein [Pseudomonas cichorii]MBX8592726.1 hypothetical protein [Pseudomonas cichorii]
MTNYETVESHIDMIRAGNTVLHNGELRTVCKSDIKRGGFMGTTLFGDSYRLGAMPVQLARIRRTVELSLLQATG